MLGVGVLLLPGRTVTDLSDGAASCHHNIKLSVEEESWKGRLCECVTAGRAIERHV